jgi:methylthioribose-1-phosphate isomerase
MPIKTLEWRGSCLKIIDQKQLPLKLVYIKCKDEKDVFNVIRNMNIRGAPAIGVAAGFGVLLRAKKIKTKNNSQFIKEIKKTISYLKKARPTAINLFWALDRMKNLLDVKKSIVEMKKLLEKEAISILEEDRKICREMAKNGARLIKNGDNILTHCNAGALATADYGTALGVLYYAKDKGKKFHVWVDETRPVLQGARLTTWELMQEKIPVTLISDNMAGYLMKLKKINKIFVGADRITSNGDFANKIGTYSLAVLAKKHKIPFYVVAPISSFDFSLKSGKDIPIEERDRRELVYIKDVQIAPKQVNVFNPAFDVTDAKYVTAFVTEKGIFYPPYFKDLKRMRQIRARNPNSINIR